MKKLMCAVVAAAGIAAISQADVESSNVVGYQQVTATNKCYSFFTVTFKNIGGGSFDIQDISVVKKDGTAADDNQIRVQKVKSDGSYDTLYNYRPSKGGWCRLSNYLGRNALMLEDGEGICVYNNNTADLDLRFSGEVNIQPMSTTVASKNYRFIGNMTPVTVDIQDIIPYANNEAYTTDNQVRVQKIKADGSYDTLYNYRPSKGGWCRLSNYLGRNALMLAPGEGLCVYNNGDVPVTFKFPNPLAK